MRSLQNQPDDAVPTTTAAQGADGTGGDAAVSPDLPHKFQHRRGKHGPGSWRICVICGLGNMNPIHRRKRASCPVKSPEASSLPRRELSVDEEYRMVVAEEDLVADADELIAGRIKELGLSYEEVATRAGWESGLMVQLFLQGHERFSGLREFGRLCRALEREPELSFAES